MGWTTISTEEYIWIVFSCISAILYGVIVYIIVSSRCSHQNTFFYAPFFTIILIQAVHGLLLFFTVNFIMRPRKFRLIIYPVTNDSKIVEYTYYWYMFLKNNLFLSYIVVAANRMTVFVFTTTHRIVWSNKVIYTIILLGYVFNFILRYLSHEPGMKFATNVNYEQDLFMFIVPPFMSIFDAVLDITLSIGSGTICTIMYIITAYWAKYTAITGNKKKRELIILRSAVINFILLLPSAVRGGLLCYATAYKDDELALATNKANTYFVEGMFVAEPWILLVTFHSIRSRVAYMVGSVILSGGSNVENASSIVPTTVGVRQSMFILTR